MKRLFIAIDLPDHVKNYIEETVAYEMEGVKWSDENQYHITLNFIGEVDGLVFREIKESLRSINKSSFSLNIKSVGYFKSPSSALWLGVERNEALFNLKQGIDQTLQSIQRKKNKRKYFPHVTIGKIKDSTDTQLQEFIQKFSLLTISDIPVKSFQLFSSELSPKGATHWLEAEYHLRQNEGMNKTKIK